MTAVATRTAAGLRLELDRVWISYGQAHVVRDVSLTVEPGEIFVLLGPSGSGKSTLLRAIAGLHPTSAGEISADGTKVREPSRDRAVVFQDNALLPWRTVRQNIELALKLRGVAREGRREQANDWITELGLDGFGDYLPKSLSGGMRQRVQLARGLAGAPRAVLMDEPFGALDTQTRASMQRLLIQTWQTHPTTIVFVTHDVDEALLLGDRIAVLGRAGEPLRAIFEIHSRRFARQDVPQPRDAHTDRTQLRAEIIGSL